MWVRIVFVGLNYCEYLSWWVLPFSIRSLLKNLWPIHVKTPQSHKKCTSICEDWRLASSKRHFSFTITIDLGHLGRHWLGQQRVARQHSTMLMPLHAPVQPSRNNIITDERTLSIIWSHQGRLNSLSRWEEWTGLKRLDKYLIEQCQDPSLLV